jgi:signal transduction histidine kinase
VHVSIKPEQNGICIVVRDHGKGIPQKDQARIFERFERAISENEVSGMGLGLYISQSIAHLHGGEIRLKSEVDEGAEFSVALPMEKGTNL